MEFTYYRWHILSDVDSDTNVADINVYDSNVLVSDVYDNNVSDNSVLDNNVACNNFWDKVLDKIASDNTFIG